MKQITEIAKELSIPDDLITTYGNWKAKINLKALQQQSPRNKGKLVLITGMTPTPQGEGKTVTSIGLSIGLNRLGYRSILCLRQPSLGPVFGIKGGAAGGGKATVEPMQDINLRFTGDFDAITSTHNLLSAVVDNHIFQGNELGIDPDKVIWPRTLDMNDRALRRILLSNKSKLQREGEFVITAASEIMAVLCLSKDYADLKSRLGEIIIGYRKDDTPIRAKDLKIIGSMSALLKEAMEPNLVQTSEGTPAFVHGGPFGNIAHGTASITSMELARTLSDYFVVEAGFATELGAEKFFDIVTQLTRFNVDIAVIVVTIRALKHHGGALDVAKSNLNALGSGMSNLAKHIENVKLFGIQPIVALNRFPYDEVSEIELLGRFCESEKVPMAISTVFRDGGEGSLELAKIVAEYAKSGFASHPLYNKSDSVKSKLDSIARKLYGADGVEYSEEAERDISQINSLGLSDKPICVAKTPLSLSDDPKKIGRPSNFVVHVKKMRPKTGAGFNIAYMGDIVTMPGLPKNPAAEKIEFSDDGVISGVF